MSARHLKRIPRDSDDGELLVEECRDALCNAVTNNDAGRRVGVTTRPDFASAARDICLELSKENVIMIIIGLVLLLIGFLTSIAILWTLGVIVIVVGVVLWILGSVGHAVGGRRHYF